MLNRDVREILNSFRLGADTIDVKAIPGGTANKNYFVSTENTIYVLRERSAKYSSEEQIVFEYEYLKRLKDKDIPAPLPFLTKEGACFVVRGPSTYQLFDCLPGKDMDPSEDENVALAGEFLAKMHNGLEGFVPDRDRALPRYDDPRVSMEAIEKVIKSNPASEGPLYYLYSRTQNLLKIFPDEIYHKLPKTYIHGDYHPANIKMHEGEISGIFDFDWVSLQPRLRDVSDGMIYFASLREKNIESNNIYSLAAGYVLNPKRCKIFVEAYVNNLRGKISPDEWKYVVCFMEARLIHSRVQALAKIPVEHHKEMLTGGMEKILSDLDEYEQIFKTLQIVQNDENIV